MVERQAQNTWEASVEFWKQVAVSANRMQVVGYRTFHLELAVGSQNLDQKLSPWNAYIQLAQPRSHLPGRDAKSSQLPKKPAGLASVKREEPCRHKSNK